MAVNPTGSQSSSFGAALSPQSYAKSLNGGSQSLVGSAPDLALSIATAANNAARPNFNLAFNQMQNTMIDRLNKKITEIQNEQANSHVNDILNSERNKYVNIAQAIQPVQSSIVNDTYTNDEIGNELAALNGAVAAADGGDPSAFNAVLAHINSLSSSFVSASGYSIGIVIDDGTADLKQNGVVRVTNADGTTTQANQFSDFANTTDALNAITAAYGRENTVTTEIQIRAEALAGIMDSTQTAITSIDTQLQAGDALDMATKAGEIAKIKQEYSLQLKSLSMAFEGSQNITDALGAALADPSTQIQAGSIMSIFT